MSTSRLILHGGTALRGTVRCGGSKNAALPMMAAAILADGPVRLENVPQLSDVDTQAEVLRRLGLRVDRRGHVLRLETCDSSRLRADYEFVSRMRASFCVLGPLLARRGRAVVALPGGCAIGQRPVDLHLHGLKALGARIRLRRGYVTAEAARLVGANIDLTGPRGPTVTGTANVLCAAVLAEGKTTLRGAAREPEIVDLGHLLIAMGARIDGLGSDTLRISGVKRLCGATHRVIPDRIEAATLLLAVAITGGDATITGTQPVHLRAVLAKLEEAGFEIDAQDDHIRLSAAGAVRPVDVTAEPYPGFPTDLQAQWTALMCTAAGRSRIRDRVFPDRFLHVAELRRMGAKIHMRGNCASTSGGVRLEGAPIRACDLRASAALVLAGLAAAGRTEIEAIGHLDRGYERLDEKLRRLGADIRRRDIRPSYR